MKRRAPKRRRAGGEAAFTLVEAMVSLFVFSLIAAGATTMLIASVDAQARTAAATEQLREFQLARAILAQDFAQLIPRSRRTEGLERAPAFRADPSRGTVAFVRAGAASDPDAALSAAPVVVEYAVTEAGLVRRSRTNLDGPADVFTEERVIFAGVEAARFSFYDGAAWRQEWAVFEGGSFPRAVSVTVDLPRYGEVELHLLVGLGA